MRLGGQNEAVARQRSGDIDWEPLGSAIRERRLDRGLTLVDLARQTELSQPFLSQVETGRARPSMASLYRIANALGTTPQAFFGGPVGDAAGPTVLRSGEVRAVEVTERTAESTCHLLLAGDAPFHVLEFDGLPGEFLEYWEHDGFEAVYVIAGPVEIDLDGTVSTLETGDFVSYSARVPHRLRSLGDSPGQSSEGSRNRSGLGERARVLLMETKVETVQDRGPARHAPSTKVRQPVRKRAPSKARRTSGA
jgi:transcriptional regulator with XRE-family HTH domain